MWDWLAQLNPNVVLGVITTVGTVIYHWLSPSTQAKVQQAAADVQHTALQVADGVLNALTIAAAAQGMTRAQLQSELWAAAKSQLQHVGIDVDHMPPALNTMVNALVSKYLATYKPSST